MKNVTIGNDPKKAVINTQERLLDALLVRNVEVKMLCQGRGLCATCHVYVTKGAHCLTCLLYTSPSPRDGLLSRMPSSA